LHEKALLLKFYRLMVRVRLFERAAYRLYTEGRLPGFLHISIGQEATSVGACVALAEGDYMASTHRGHGDTLAKGVSVEAAMAELYGKTTGICNAKGGSMHIADFSRGILGANGIIAAGVPITVGAALSAKLQGKDSVALCFFGDGATGSGPLHEGMNMAMLWDLPMIFVQQNNRYAESTPLREHTGIKDVVDWASGYGMPACRVDGNNVIEVYENVQAAVARARSGQGPTFIQSMTYRHYGHNIGDPGTWRPTEEVEEWKQRDPIDWLTDYLLETENATEATLDQITEEEQAALDHAIDLAEAAPLPNPEDALKHLYNDPELGQQALRTVQQ
jgi:TPP-dependent pyruvate/acetoin dehydrogenase alpha subunit